MVNFFRSVCVILIPLFLIAAASAHPEGKLKKRNVPQPVLAAFEKAYPHATAKGYSKEMGNGKTEYEIESREGSIARDISFDGDGNILSVEETLAVSDLPDAVHSALMKDYPKGKIIKCEKVTENGATNFEILVKAGKKKSEVVYTPDGSRVSKEAK